MAKEFFETGDPLYLWEISKDEKLAIQYCPLEIALSSAPNMQTVFVVGRNNPYYFYTAGEDTLSLQLDFHAKAADFSDVKDRCNWLRSKRYSDGPGKGPGKFKLVFGKLFDNEIWQIKAINIRYSQFKNYDVVPGTFQTVRNSNYYPSQAYVDLLLGLDGIGVPGSYKSSNIKPSQIYK